ncbi:hypothetical protein ACQ4M3_31490 [Leptolyngbya sp. AN03gr2]|uniref:hypothetical protein n=1 Tax=unclassified Leptolyngbya TaxID=2650499 RepID=UPI003D318808
MQETVRIVTKVLPGNRIEVEVPDGSVGAEVEVIVVLPQTISTGRRNVLKLIEEIRDRHPQRSTEDIDRELAAEKDSWEKIKQIPKNYQSSVPDLNQFAGVLRCDGEDPLEFQQRIRSEWD